MEIEFTTIELSATQIEMMQWVNKHFHQLIELRKSGCLEHGGTSFTVHLKDSMSLDVPPLIDHLDLAGKYYPGRS